MIFWLTFCSLACGTAGALMLLTGRVRRPREQSTPRHNIRLWATLVRAGRMFRPPFAEFLSAQTDQRIQRAGLFGAVSTGEVSAARCGGLLLSVVVVPTALRSSPGRLGPLVVALLAAGAFFGPDIWLVSRARRRERAVLRELPQMLELLCASVAAGVPLGEAMKAVTDYCVGPLSHEIAVVSAEVSLGIPRAVALDGLAARNLLAEVRALVATLQQAERYGSSVAGALTTQAQDLRNAANRRVQDAGARAAPKIQLVIAALLVPAALLIFAAALVTAVSGGLLAFSH